MAAALFAANTTPASAGAVGGPKFRITAVDARSTDTYEITFRGGETARIEVDGDGDTDLDLCVFDRFGNLVAKDDDRTDFCVASFYVRYAQTYTIKVRNLGGVWNEYEITTN